MKYKIVAFLIITFFTSCGSNPQPSPVSLKDVLADKFLIGTAMNEDQITGVDTAALQIIKQHFNAVVAENCMKSEELHPEEDLYDFSLSDQFVRFGEENNKVITGHTLIWHSQLPEWFCTDEKGDNVSAEVLKERMKDHISTVVGRYKGCIKGWDVVNEAIEDDGSWRQSKFYEILGEEFISLAFQYAHEADPAAELYYNDYSMTLPGRREGVVRLINMLKERGIRIDAVGMQGHLGMDNPELKDFEESIRAFAGTGVNVMITELDLSILPYPSRRMSADISTNFEYMEQLNPYQEEVPEEIQTQWNNRMLDFFRLFFTYQDVISRVTVWGVVDQDSWKNDFPIKGRTDYPLLFDRNYQPKPVVTRIIEEANK